MLTKEEFISMQIAAEEGNLEACTALSFKFEYGLDDVEIDLEQAFYWLEVGSKYNDGWAQLNIADCYKAGRLGKVKDFDKALLYTKLAFENKAHGAAEALGDFYQHGIHVKKDLEKAYYYWKLGADDGSAWAQIHIAYMFEFGIGCKVDIVRAEKYLSHAISKIKTVGEPLEIFSNNAKNNYEIAIEALGFVYKKGLLGIEKDEIQSSAWFDKAAKLWDNCSRPL